MTAIAIGVLGSVILLAKAAVATADAVPATATSAAVVKDGGGWPGTKTWEIDAENYLTRVVDPDFGVVCYVTKNEGLKPGTPFCVSAGRSR